LFHADAKLEVLDPIRLLNVDTNEEIVIRDQEHRPVKNDYYYINLTRTIMPAKYKLSVNFKSLTKSLYENRGVFAATYLDDLVER
jgi:hypothetical protein